MAEILVDDGLNQAGVKAQGQGVQPAEPTAAETPPPATQPAQPATPTQPATPAQSAPPAQGGDIPVDSPTNTTTATAKGEQPEPEKPDEPGAEAPPEEQPEPPAVESAEPAPKEEKKLNTASNFAADKSAADAMLNGTREDGWNVGGGVSAGTSNNEKGDVNSIKINASAVYQATSEDGKTKGRGIAQIGLGNESGSGSQSNGMVVSGLVGAEVARQVAKGLDVIAGVRGTYNNSKTDSELQAAGEGYAGVAYQTEDGKSQLRATGGYVAGKAVDGESVRAATFNASASHRVSENGTLSAGLSAIGGGNIESSLGLTGMYTHHLKEGEVPTIITKTPEVETRTITDSKISLGSDQLFGFDKDKFRPEGAAKLDALANTLTNPANGAGGISFVDQIKAQGGKINISGFTDAFGKDNYNQALSERRAEAVMAYLESKGVPRELMTAQGYGESQAHNRDVIDAMQKGGKKGSAEYKQMQDAMGTDRRVDVAIVGASLKPTDNPELVAKMKESGFNVESSSRTVQVDKAAPVVNVAENAAMAAQRQATPKAQEAAQAQPELAQQTPQQSSPSMG